MGHSPGPRVLWRGKEAREAEAVGTRTACARVLRGCPASSRCDGLSAVSRLLWHLGPRWGRQSPGRGDSAGGCGHMWCDHRPRSSSAAPQPLASAAPTHCWTLEECGGTSGCRPHTDLPRWPRSWPVRASGIQAPLPMRMLDAGPALSPVLTPLLTLIPTMASAVPHMVPVITGSPLA